MSDSTVTLRYETKKRLWVVWQRGPITIVAVRFRYRFLGVAFRHAGWRHYYCYVLRVGPWLWQRSNFAAAKMQEAARG